MSELINEAEKYTDEMVNLRRWFHEHPESSFREVTTAERIRSELDRLGLSWEAVGNGTVAVLEGKDADGPVIGLRADIDALEITEKNDVPYRSLNEGLMHACGHDAHIAALFGAIEILKQHREEFSGRVKFIFQPAEEIGKGAQTIVDSGLISDVDAFFGIHVKSLREVGYIEASAGAIMGGANSLDITLTGKSGHGGRPYQAIDTITCGAQIVQGLQYIVSREIPANDAAVITVGQFHAGTRDNIVAGSAHISGTVRILDDGVREKVASSVRRYVKGISEAANVKAEVRCEFATPVLYNSGELYDDVVESAGKVVSKDAVIPVKPDLGTEDFSAYSQIAPSFFVFVGAGGDYPHHHERFDIDERVLPISAALHASFALDQFKKRRIG
ncbi:MAG: amidohydrolase [Lachnospiraceae bacterium]|nr:amidohydrolase [Lachnospiraceae bacterium]MBP1584837.1 amidohydrolase [Lachnospiraceae bacterium]